MVDVTETEMGHLEVEHPNLGKARLQAIVEGNQKVPQHLQMRVLPIIIDSLREGPLSSPIKTKLNTEPKADALIVARKAI